MLLVTLAIETDAADRFVAPLPREADIEIRRDLVYKQASEGSRAFDLYLPAKRAGSVPVVIFVNGIGADWMRAHAQYTGWAQAVTARGLAGVTMDSREASVDDDVRALISHLAKNAGALGVDASRVALWSCSANVTRGLPLAQSLGPPIRSAVVYYGTTENVTFKRDLPVLFVRAGRDGANLNRRLEALLAQAFAENAPIEAMNVASGVHGFDVRDDNEASRAAIARTLDFLALTLAGPYSRALEAGEMLARASAATYRGDWPAAATAYEALTKDNPSDSLMWQQLGEARRETGDASGAISAFEKSLELGSPNRGIVSFALATLYAQAGNIEKAFSALQGMKPQLRFFASRLRAEPVFEAVRKDPRFEPLMKDVPPPPAPF